jgi:hypothetical protein
MINRVTKQVVITSSTRWMNPNRITIVPISKGPNSGYDYLHIEPVSERDFGPCEIRRIDSKQVCVADYGCFPDWMTAMAEAKRLCDAQSDKDCQAVTGNGRWGCD